jgi:hypothetical protein
MSYMKYIGVYPKSMIKASRNIQQKTVGIRQYGSRIVEMVESVQIIEDCPEVYSLLPKEILRESHLIFAEP